MPELLIRIKKKSDGAAAPSAVSADGTTTWRAKPVGQALELPFDRPAPPAPPQEASVRT